MTRTLGQLADLVGGRLIGDPQRMIERPATLNNADEQAITFIDQGNRIESLRESGAAAIISGCVFEDLDSKTRDLAIILVEDAHKAFSSIVALYRPPRPVKRQGVSSLAILSKSVTLGEDVEIHPGAILGDEVVLGSGSTIHAGVRILPGCVLGEEVTLMPGVVLYENTKIGDRTLVHAGAVIGAYGFGYQFSGGEHVRTAQLGHVEIGADVEIGANTTIDRGTYDATTIGEGTKIDNLVMIAHNCRIGRHNMICSQVGVAGSTSTGDYVVLAGQVGLRDHIHVGTGAMVGAMAGVSNDIPEGTQYFGSPATPAREQKIKQAALSKLPQMRRDFRQLQREIAELRKQLPTVLDPPDDRAAA